MADDDDAKVPATTTPKATTSPSRFFVVQGHDPHNVDLSIKHGLWFASDQAIADRLASAFADASTSTAPVCLFVTVSGTGKFQGACAMTTAPGGAADQAPAVQWAAAGGVKPAVVEGRVFGVEWMHKTPMPMWGLSHIKAAGDRPFTRASDGQEIDKEQGRAVLAAFAKGPPLPRQSSGAGGKSSSAAVTRSPSPTGVLDLADMSYERYLDLYGKVQTRLGEAKAASAAAASAVAAAGGHLHLHHQQQQQRFGPPPPHHLQQQQQQQQQPMQQGGIVPEEQYVAQCFAMYRQRGMPPPAEAMVRTYYRQMRQMVESGSGGGRGAGGMQPPMQPMMAMGGGGMMMPPQQQGPPPFTMGMMPMMGGRGGGAPFGRGSGRGMGHGGGRY